MKKSIVRGFALALAVLMCLSLLPPSARAGGDQDYTVTYWADNEHSQTVPYTGSEQTYLKFDDLQEKNSDFKVPDGNVLLCWRSDSGSAHNPGDAIGSLSGNLTLRAVWLSIQADGKIVSKAAVGTKLEAVLEGGSDTDTISYQWRHDSSNGYNDCDGANSSFYTLSEDDLFPSDHPYMYCMIRTYNGLDVYTASESVKIVAELSVPTASLLVNEKAAGDAAHPGDKLSVNVENAEGEYTCTWLNYISEGNYNTLADGQDSYELTSSDVGRTIFCSVRGSSADWIAQTGTIDVTVEEITINLAQHGEGELAVYLGETSVENLTDIPVGSEVKFVMTPDGTNGYDLCTLTEYDSEGKLVNTRIANKYGAQEYEFTVSAEQKGYSFKAAFAQSGIRSVTLTARGKAVSRAATATRLTAEVVPWSETTKDFEYQWRRGGNAIAGETGSTYKTTAADIGKRVDCLVRVKDSNYDGVPSNRVGIVAQLVANLLVNGNEAGKEAYPGDKLSVEVENAEGAYTCTWLEYKSEDNYEELASGQETYELTPADVGRTILCSVNDSDDRHAQTDTIYVSAEKVTINLAKNGTGNLKVSVNGKPAEDLTDIPAGSTVRFEITPDGTKGYDLCSLAEKDSQGKPVKTHIDNKYGAQKYEFTVSAEQNGYSFVITFAQSGIKSVTLTADGKVVSSVPVGTELTAAAVPWSEATKIFEYQWRRDGEALAGKTGSTYTTSADDVGHKLDCLVRVQSGNYDGVLSGSVSVLDRKPIEKADVLVDGKPDKEEALFSQTLSVVVTPAELKPDDPKYPLYKYQWYSGDTAIAGATEASFVPADDGTIVTGRSSLRCKVQYADEIGEALWSYPTIVMKETVFISFDPNGATGEMKAQPAARDEDATLNELAFEAPKDHEFLAWAGDDGRQYSDQEKVHPDKDLKLTAVWKDVTKMQPVKGAEDDKVMVGQTLYIPETVAVYSCRWYRKAAPALAGMSAGETFLTEGEEDGDELIGTGTSYTLTKADLGRIVYAIVIRKNGNKPGDAWRTGNITVTASYTLISVTVTKHWDDCGNADGIRPDSITVNLLADGAVVNKAVLSSGNNWSYTFKGLHDSNYGKMIVYTVSEPNVPAGYTCRVRGYDITNSHVPATAPAPDPAPASRTTEEHDVPIVVRMVWDDNGNAAGKRPAYVIAVLLRDGSEVARQRLDDNNGWTYRWLMRKGYTYSVAEEPVENYETVIGKSAYHDDAAGDGTLFTITNTYKRALPGTSEHAAYIFGYPDGTVRPERNITRAEAAAIFFRLLTDETRELYRDRTNPFSDVNAEDWFNEAISTLNGMGILNGYDDGTFRPDNCITRAELTKIAVSFSTAAGLSGKAASFADVAADAWYGSCVASAQELGLVNGYEDGTFHPDSFVTRAETCAIVNRVFKRTPHKDHLLPANEMNMWPDNAPDAWYYADVQEATNSHACNWIDKDGKAVEEWVGRFPE